MKKLLFVLAFILSFAAVPLQAQTYLTNTTLSASITATQTTLTVASATNIAAGGALFIDHEVMSVVSVSGTTITVTRTQRPQAHASSAVVYVATVAQRPFVLLTHDGARRMGQCSTSTSSTPATALASIRYLPLIDIDTGDFYNCRRNGASGSWVWNVTNVQALNGEAGSVPTAWP